MLGAELLAPENAVAGIVGVELDKKESRFCGHLIAEHRGVCYHSAWCEISALMQTRCENLRIPQSCCRVLPMLDLNFKSSIFFF